MYTVSFDLQLPLCITVYNQCLRTEFVLLAYFGNGIVCPKLSHQQMEIEIDTTTEIQFKINATQDEFEGVLLYELRICSVWPHPGVLTARSVTKPTRIQMLIVWKKERFTHSANVMLLENARSFEWNENKLRKLYDKNYDRLKGYNDAISEAWLIDDNKVLRTAFEVRNLKRTPELIICIHEEEEYTYAMRPLWFDEER
jgi:hypothetical protein